MNNDKLDKDWLELLSDVQIELCKALKALEGKEAEGLHERYRFHAAGHVHCAVEGYIHLRRGGRIEASKHLIRTAIEVSIRLLAITKQPEVLFQIAWKEFNDNEKWARPLPGSYSADTLKAIAAQRVQFKQDYQTKYPKHGLVENGPDLRTLAVVAELDGFYDSHYRLYCRFTHAALDATTGDLAAFQKEDNLTMALCALTTLQAVVSIGAPSPNLPILLKRRAELMGKVEEIHQARMNVAPPASQ